MRSAAAGLTEIGTLMAVTVARLVAVLNHEGEFWGDDEAGRSFAQRYKGPVEEGIQAISATARFVESIGAKLDAATAVLATGDSEIGRNLASEFVDAPNKVTVSGQIMGKGGSEAGAPSIPEANVAEVTASNDSAPDLRAHVSDDRSQPPRDIPELRARQHVPERPHTGGSESNLVGFQQVSADSGFQSAMSPVSSRAPLADEAATSVADSLGIRSSSTVSALPEATDSSVLEVENPNSRAVGWKSVGEVETSQPERIATSSAGLIAVQPQVVTTPWSAAAGRPQAMAVR